LNESERTEVRGYLGPIHDLLSGFAGGVVPADEFEDRFFPDYAELSGELSHYAFMATEWLFGAVEEWNADDRLREPGVATTQELRKQIADFLEQIGYETRHARVR
jgi:hypothetical protein